MSSVVNGSFNSSIMGLEEPKPLATFEFTSIKVQKIALYSLSFLLVGGSAALIGVSIAGIITWPIAFTAIPFIAAAAGIISYAIGLKDYENPVDLHRMRQKASKDSFSEIIKEHGFENVKQYQILSKSALQQKFSEEYQFAKLS